MSAFTLDERPALVVIDLQAGIVAMPTAHPTAEIVARSAELAAAFREAKLPVVLVNVTGRPGGRTDVGAGAGALDEDWARLVPELNAAPTDHRVTKRTWGAFHRTGLHELLQDEGVTQVVIVGISTSAGVESTARSAHEHGYNVALAVDAMTDRDRDRHENSVSRIFPALGEVTDTAEVLALLAER